MDPIVWRDDATELGGTWQFFPGDHELGELDALLPQPIVVPGLWETQGHLELDGVAWYRCGVEIAELGGFWTLRFDAVMDIADVYLNGHHLGRHELPFTPFEFDVTHCLQQGENTLALRVVDPAADDPEHRRIPHGKQGWANEAFPGPPSLYLTYGGIWQPVTLRRHGAIVIDEVFVNSDPDSLQVTVELVNRSGTTVRAWLSVETLGSLQKHVVELTPAARQTVMFDLGVATAPHWSPETPELNELSCLAVVDDRISDTRELRYGLRRIALDGTRLLVDKTPYRMKSALVQGFSSDELYGAQTREAIVSEVAAAKSLGFNTLRLHIKAFEPQYLDVCDEVGMFLHCDIPIAEPFGHRELDTDTRLAQRALAAAQAQVRRDRNHPSVILWSATNEFGLEQPDTRETDGYAEFMRSIVAVITSHDGTRPIIENDWIEPDPEHVFAADTLSAHWYGRLDRQYLTKLDRQAENARGLNRPLFITELGDWGLPATTVYSARLAQLGLDEPPLEAELATTPWAGDYVGFANGTQRYKGLSDRLQIETLRRHDHVGGYGVTELTDVPYELNGVLDLERREKPAVAAEMRRANQVVLPILALDAYTFVAGQRIYAPLHVANDGPQLGDVEVAIHLGPSVTAVSIATIPAHEATACAEVELLIPRRVGNYECLLELRAGGKVVSENSYPIHVAAAPEAPITVRLIGPSVGHALSRVGAQLGAHGPAVITEGALDAATGAEIGALLRQDEAVLLLAQEPDSARHLPFAAALSWLGTGWDDSDNAGWGSSAFRFTTITPSLTSLPDCTVLSTEDMTAPPRCVFTSLLGRPWPNSTALGVYKPAPNPLQGALIGEVVVGSGRLVFCQLPLETAVAAGDAFASALLHNLLLSVSSMVISEVATA